ncbi:MAG TPA: glutathione S-transferase family protein, partial [Rhodospirillales bacterium]|nr:glutathione S-transferase family protein [Rhodospirillales bacterium]
KGGFTAEAGRYHLYVSLACPWAHRTLILRKLKGLEDVIGVSVVNPLWLEFGWTLDEGADQVNGKRFLHEIYTLAKPDYSGRVTVPVLWDKKTKTIVSNESSEIIRMFNTAFNAFGDASVDFYPQDLQDEIDTVNTFVYGAVNNGVYKAGFATVQDAYEDAFSALFEALDGLEERLSKQRYLTGARITEADWRLFTTLVRFDAVYVTHFKCNKQRLVDYPNLWGYFRDLYQVPGVAGTVNMDHIKRHYFGSHRKLNPSGVVPLGPDLDFMTPPAREGMENNR